MRWEIGEALPDDLADATVLTREGKRRRLGEELEGEAVGLARLRSGGAGA
jgi:hypothetical protein